GAAASPGPSLPAGWRWESYRDVEVGVPGTWGYAPPLTGRRMEHGRNYVALMPAGAGPVRSGHQRSVLIPNTISKVVIRAGDPLRAQIAATVHRITEADANGCAVHHPIAEQPTWRPTPVDIATLTGIDALRACRYTTLDPAADAGPTVSLYSSLLLRDDVARGVVAAIAAAPAGTGPNIRPCSSENVGEWIVVQGLRGSTVVGDVVVRYAGCRRNGFDDGVTLRKLTPTPEIQQLFARSNRPISYLGSTGIRKD
ncbi:MAG TPA: hypothetical protein VNC22_07520, partial [Sporichthya sp.]|nr:hypothetical protein [Sporichthya sp.]